MTTIAFRFPAGRYHATPWGDHVNEGTIEWPSSPWRILRALLSVGYTKCGWTNLTTTARALVESLASVLPRYRLPRAVATHSRHYMPIGGFTKQGIENTTLVFDACARILDGRDELLVTWDVTLPDAERELLVQLVDRMAYLGRAESWVDARVIEDPPPRDDDVLPSDPTLPKGPGWEQVSVLAPMEVNAYSAWRASRAAVPGTDDTASSKAKRKPPAKAKAKPPAADPAPEDLIACLQATTATLQAQGWTQPPGSRRVLYWRRTDALEAAAPAMAARPTRAAPVEMMLLSLSSAARAKGVLPHVHRTLPTAELFHRAIVSRLRGRYSACLVGKADGGARLQGHRHAHVLPVDLDGDDHIDHVVLWAPMGFDSADQATIRSVRELFADSKMRAVATRVARDEAGPERASEEELVMKDAIRVGVAGAGDLALLDGLARRSGFPVSKVGATRWVSATPFVAPRYLHASGRHSLEDQIRSELSSRGLPGAQASIEVSDRPDPDFRHYVLRRVKGNAPPSLIGLRVVLELPTPAPLLCLGYGAHYGLGRFRPLSDRSD